jgi:hypothetical protein
MSNTGKWYMVRNNPRQYNLCMKCNKVGNINMGNSKAKIPRCKFCGDSNLVNMMAFKTYYNVPSEQMEAFNKFKDYCGMGNRAIF